MNLSLILITIFSFSSHAWAQSGYYERCPKPSLEDHWSGQRFPSLRKECKQDNSPQYRRIRKIYDQIIESNLQNFINPELYKNVCLSLESGNFGGVAESDSSTLYIHSSAFGLSDAGLSLLIAHEIGHFMQPPKDKSLHEYDHPELLKNPEYKKLFDRAKQLRIQSLNHNLRLFNGITRQLEKPDKNIEDSKRFTLFKLAQLDPESLSQVQLDRVKKGLQVEEESSYTPYYFVNALGYKIDEFVEFSGTEQLQDVLKQLDEIAKQHFGGEHHHIFDDEFQADRIGFMLLQNTTFDQKDSTKQFLDYIWHNKSPIEREKCDRSILSGKVPPIDGYGSDTHPSYCRRQYELTVKMPNCVNSVDSEKALPVNIEI